MKKSILLAVAAALTLAACNKDEEIVNNGSVDEDMTSNGIYTADDLKPGDYFYRTEGGEWAVSDGGLRKVYPDGTMEWAKPKPQRDDSKGTCIGVVFAVGQSGYDKSDYSAIGINQAQCHGYVVALHDATFNNMLNDLCMWGEYGVELGCYPKNDDGTSQNNSHNPEIDWSGYAYTWKIINHVDGKDNLEVYEASYYAVVDYEIKVAAPTNSSGWFLPSIGQLWQIYQLRDKLPFTDAGGSGLQNWCYWSSSEVCSSPSYLALCMDVNLGEAYSWHKYNYSCFVRAVLAF